MRSKYQLTISKEVKMFKSFVMLLILLSFSFLLGCNEKSTEPIAETANTILPLAEGNVWNYRIYDQSSNSIGQVVWKINKKVTVGSEEYFLIEMNGFGNGSYLAKHQSDGLFLSSYDSTNVFSSSLFFKYPANDNETYQYQMVGTDSILSITVKKQNLLIGDENYSCYAYINHNLKVNPNKPFMYFAENIGLIRHKLYHYTANGIDTTKYILYDLESKIIND